MTDHLSALPYEILCYLLSFLTLRDSVRTRVLSPRCRYLYDNRSVLNFDAVNVLGSQKCAYESYERSKFVTVIDQFLEIKKGRKLNELTVKFSLGNKQASHIDLWVESGIRMGIETLKLDIYPPVSDEKYVCQFIRPRVDEKYVLSDKLFHCGKDFHLRCLRLDGCALTFSSGYTSWMSHLTTLELTFVPLHQKDIECVMSGGLNLTSLRLAGCITPKFSSINVELLRLKKLYLSDSLTGIELNCPNLVSLVCVDQADYFNFSHVPFLTQVILGLMFFSPGCLLIFDELAKHAPKLQTLSIYTLTEVYTHTPKEQIPQTEFIDIPHFYLKEVSIGRLRRKRREMEFVRYLLKNALALERMIIEEECFCPSPREEMGISRCTLWEEEMCCATSHYFEERITYFIIGTAISYCYSRREELAKTLLQDLNTNAQLVFRTRRLGIVLNASNLVDYGLQLSSPGS